MMKEKLNINLRSQSKTSEISSKVFRRTPSFQISESKWREILEEEYYSSVVNSILNDILSLTMDAIYNAYLEKTIYSFVVHCSHLAWLQLFDAMDLPYDLGENSASIKQYWRGDEELKPPAMDSWSCKNVEIRKQPQNCSSSEHCQESVN